MNVQLVANQLIEQQRAIGLGGAAAGAQVASDVGTIIGVGLMAVGAAVAGAWLFPHHRAVAAAAGAGIVIGGFIFQNTYGPHP